MDNFLNFVYDDWDDVNDLPSPNRLSDYVHQDDNENTWVLSTQPMAVYALTKIWIGQIKVINWYINL